MGGHMGLQLLSPLRSASQRAAAAGPRDWPAQPFRIAREDPEDFPATYPPQPRGQGALARGPFEPVVRDGCAYAGVCLVEVAAMRPAGLPAWLGCTYHEAVYRLIVEYQSPHEGPLRGIVSPRADAAQPAIVGGGRPLSHHPFPPARLTNP